MRWPRRSWRIQQTVRVPQFSEFLSRRDNWEQVGLLPNKFFTKRGCSRFIDRMFEIAPVLARFTHFTPVNIHAKDESK